MQKWDNNFVSSSVKTSGRLVIMMVTFIPYIYLYLVLLVWLEQKDILNRPSQMQNLIT